MVYAQESGFSVESPILWRTSCAWWLSPRFHCNCINNSVMKMLLLWWMLLLFLNSAFPNWFQNNLLFACSPRNCLFPDVRCVLFVVCLPRPTDNFQACLKVWSVQPAVWQNEDEACPALYLPTQAEPFGLWIVFLLISSYSPVFTQTHFAWLCGQTLGSIRLWSHVRSW